MGGVRVLRRFVPAVAVAAGLVAVGGIAAGIKTTAPESTAVTVRQVPVSGAVRACPPGVAGPGSSAQSDRVAVFSASGLPGGQGGVTLAGLPQARASATASTPGTLALLDAPSSLDHRSQAWSLTASGSMAPGLAAEVADASGLGRLSCPAPGSDIWFVGPGQQNGATQIRLDLMNVDVLAATVKVNVITDAGLVQPASFSGISVPPHGLVTESLNSVASGASVVAIEVRTTTGRVAAAVSESASHGPSSWIPAGPGPALNQVIAGVPPSGANPGLLLAVPGGANARVSVTAITAQGRYQPLGSQQIDLPGQSASFVQLPALGGAAVGLVLSSNVPVTAGVLVPGGGVGAFTVPVASVAEHAVIAGNVDGGGLTATLTLTAPGDAARVSLTEVAGSARATSQLTVPGGRTLTVPVSPPRGTRRGTPFSVIITPLSGSGPVYAARVETQGQSTVVSVIPALSALSTITLPPSRDTYAAVSP